MTKSLLLLLLLALSLLVSLSCSHFSPIDNYLLDCGSCSKPVTLDDHRVFTHDSNFVSSSATQKVSIANSRKISPLYDTARIFTKPSAYEFQIKARGTHLIRLHFSPYLSDNFNLSSAKFHVLASGFVLLQNFSFEVHEGVSNSLKVKEYFVNLDSDKLILAFIPASTSSFAFVNAIEVVSAPDDLFGDKARLVRNDIVESFYGLNKQALQSFYRVNVGGAKVTPFNDTFWRNWVPDSSSFIASASHSEIVTFGGRIMYRKYGASPEVVPENVLNNARVSKTNMTWAFAVDPDYKYLVRLHFCDIASLVLNELYLDIYINGHLAYKDFDISDAVGYLASPYYIDFVVDAGKSGYLSIIVGPSKITDASKSRVGALLNGLEIMKINNSVGSLDGDFAINFVLENPRVVGSFVAVGKSLVCGLAFVCMLAAVFILVLKLKTERNDSLAWSRLPVDVFDTELPKGSAMASGKLVYF